MAVSMTLRYAYFGECKFCTRWQEVKMMREEGMPLEMRLDGVSGVPFPLDHFFFCFLPAAAAAGA